MVTTSDLGSAAALLVVAGSGYDPRRRRDNHVLHTESSADVIARVAGALRELGGEAHAWMETPAVSLVFLEGRTVLGEYGVLSGRAWIRTPADGDRALRSPVVGAWLDAVGVEEFGA